VNVPGFRIQCPRIPGPDNIGDPVKRCDHAKKEVVAAGYFNMPPEAQP
jgi:hypothetical protein